MRSRTLSSAAPTHESMRRAHRVRRFRRGNAEHGRAYLGHKAKPWKTANPTIARSAA